PSHAAPESIATTPGASHATRAGIDQGQHPWSPLLVGAQFESARREGHRAPRVRRVSIAARRDRWRAVPRRPRPPRAEPRKPLAVHLTWVYSALHDVHETCP